MTRRMLLEGPGCACDGFSRNILSLEWLFQRPSALLWADEILVSSADYEYVTAGQSEDSGLYEECAAILFDILHNEGIIRVINPNDFLHPISRDSISEQVLFDLNQFGTAPSEPNEDGKVEPAMVRNEFGSFCGPMLESMYTNLLMSNLMHCSCLVDARKAQYLMHRFDRTKERGLSHGNTFDKLYSVSIPELLPCNDFRLFCPENIASKCANEKSCIADASRNTRKYVDTILFYRSNSEIRGLSNLIEKYENEYFWDDDAVTDAVMRDIIKAQKNLNSSLPEAHRWCEIVTGTASAVAISNMLASNNTASTVAAAAATVSYIGDKLSDYLIDRNSWKITFADKYISNELKAASS